MPAAKVKVSVTVDRQLLRQVERLGGGANRSEIFERALAMWVRGRAQADLDRAVEAYYVSRAAAEQGEDDAWAAAGDAAVRGQWSK